MKEKQYHIIELLFYVKTALYFLRLIVQVPQSGGLFSRLVLVLEAVTELGSQTGGMQALFMHFNSWFVSLMFSHFFTILYYIIHGGELSSGIIKEKISGGVLLQGSVRCGQLWWFHRGSSPEASGTTSTQKCSLPQ